MNISVRVSTRVNLSSYTRFGITFGAAWTVLTDVEHGLYTLLSEDQALEVSIDPEAANGQEFRLVSVSYDEVSKRFYANGEAVGISPADLELIQQVIGGGKIDASVQPRSGLLVDLLALAGLSGEVSHPTDYPRCRVKHNGVAGEAELILPSVTRIHGLINVSSGSKNIIDSGELVAFGANNPNTFKWNPLKHGENIVWDDIQGGANIGSLMLIDVSEALSAAVTAVLKSATPTLTLTIPSQVSVTTIQAVNIANSVKSRTHNIAAVGGNTAEFVVSARPSAPAVIGLSATRLRNSVQGELVFASNDVVTCLNNTQVGINLSMMSDLSGVTLRLPAIANMFETALVQDFYVLNSSDYTLSNLTVTAAGGENYPVKGVPLNTLAPGQIAIYKALPNLTWYRVF